MVTEIMDAYRFVPFLHPVTPTPWFSSLQLDFQHIFRQKNSTWRNDGDGGGGGGGGVPTTLAHCSSPSLNARREKISRKGKPLTLINTEINTFRTKVCKVGRSPPIPVNSLIFFTFPSKSIVLYWARDWEIARMSLRHPLWLWPAVACLPQCVEPRKQSPMRYSFFQ